jgi:hypothetical protein
VLVVTTDPLGARIIVDGEDRGQGPLTLKDQKAGTVTVASRIEGYEEMSETSLVEIGKTTTIALAMSKKMPAVQIGELFAGGFVFYLDGKGGGSVAAPVDQSKDTKWHNASPLAVGAWATGIGSGKANTAMIVSKEGIGSYAASLCDALVSGGYDDWYLPSKDELNLMYRNLKVQGRGGFGDAYYWSSSEYTNLHAFQQFFFDGTQSATGGGSQWKKASGYLRAVRAF